jgi:hypothetical protein
LTASTSTVATPVSVAAIGSMRTSWPTRAARNSNCPPPTAALPAGKDVALRSIAEPASRRSVPCSLFKLSVPPSALRASSCAPASRLMSPNALRLISLARPPVSAEASSRPATVSAPVSAVRVKWAALNTAPAGKT